MDDGWRLSHWRTKGEHATLASVDEGRKRVLVIAASILVADGVACRQRRSMGGADHAAHRWGVFKQVGLALCLTLRTPIWACYSSGNQRTVFSSQQNVRFTFAMSLGYGSA